MEEVTNIMIENLKEKSLWKEILEYLVNTDDYDEDMIQKTIEDYCTLWKCDKCDKRIIEPFESDCEYCEGMMYCEKCFFGKHECSYCDKYLNHNCYELNKCSECNNEQCWGCYQKTVELGEEVIEKKKYIFDCFNCRKLYCENCSEIYFKYDSKKNKNILSDYCGKYVLRNYCKNCII